MNNHVLSPELYVKSHARQIIDNLDVSTNTRAEYNYRISLFLQYLKEHGFNRNSYLDYKRHLGGQNNLSVSTKNKYLIVARIYCRELNRQGLLPLDITQGIKSFQQSRKHKKEGLTDCEVSKVIDYLHQLPPTSQNLRLKAIICLLVLQGLRQCEVVRLNVKDIDFASQRAFVLGKGKDDTEPIDLHPETARILKEYLLLNEIADGPLFVSTSNNSRQQRLSTKSIRNIINPVLRNLEVYKSVHGFRHYFTTKLIQSYKGDLLEVARYTRHKSLEMLQVYNDNIKRKADLPRYYETFQDFNF